MSEATPAGLVTISARRPCLLCGVTARVDVEPAAAAALARGVPVQLALPQVDPPVRELIISGTHPRCWEDLFGPIE